MAEGVPIPPTTKDLSSLRVLAAFAHPDDEGFGCGGTLAMLADRGARVTLVCATNGDVGEISDPSLATPETLAQVRQQELRQAMAVTGVADLRFLGYRDSGMAGSPENGHPASLHQAEPGMVVAQLVRLIREVRPEVIFTHDPSGGYGHPDHLAVHRHVTQAFALAGEAASYPEQQSLLYYVCFPRSNFRRMWQRMVDLGVRPPFAGRDLDSLGSPDEAVTTVLDVSQYVNTKIASLRCHRTQIAPDGPFGRLPAEVLRELSSTEYFTLARPPEADTPVDLLAGLLDSGEPPPKPGPSRRRQVQRRRR